jgi:hypothetical protein
MTRYVVLNLNNALASTFNEAAKILKDHKDINVLSSVEARNDRGMFLIDTTEAAVNTLRKALPGWKIAPDNLIQ